MTLGREFASLPAGSPRPERGGGGALEGVSPTESDPVQVRGDQGPGPGDGDLVIGDRRVPTELPDDRPDLPQAGPGHVREQVVLNLIVQPAHRQRGDPAASYVAGHQDLPAEEIDAT